MSGQRSSGVSDAIGSGSAEASPAQTLLLVAAFGLSLREPAEVLPAGKAYTRGQATVDWDDVRHFLALARTGSVRAAGSSLNVSHSTVARRIEALELRLGVKRFDRHRDGYLLTDAGNEMVAAAERVEREMMALERSLAGQDARLAGPVRVPYGPLIRVARWFGNAPVVHIYDRDTIMRELREAGFTQVQERDVGAEKIIAFIVASKPR